MSLLLLFHGAGSETDAQPGLAAAIHGRRVAAVKVVRGTGLLVAKRATFSGLGMVEWPPDDDEALLLLDEE